MGAAPLSTPIVNTWRLPPLRRNLTSCPLMALRLNFNSLFFSDPVRNRPATTSSARSLDDEACFAGSASNCAADFQSLAKFPIHPALEALELLAWDHFLRAF